MPHKAVDPRFTDLIDLNAQVRQLGSGFTFTEGPLWHPHERHLIFSDMPGNALSHFYPILFDFILFCTRGDLEIKGVGLVVQQ